MSALNARMKELDGREVRTGAQIGVRGSAESGYTLLFVVFLVAITLISTAIVVPNMLTQGRREKEAEMIWRGHQYERGIRRYMQKFGKYPTSVDDLVKPTNGIRYMRQAYKDPTSPDGKWRFIYVSPTGALLGSTRFISLQQLAMFDQMIQQGMNPACFGMLGLKTGGDSDSSSGSGSGSGGFSSYGSSFGNGQSAKPGQPGQAGQPGQGNAGGIPAIDFDGKQPGGAGAMNCIPGAGQGGVAMNGTPAGAMTTGIGGTGFGQQTANGFQSTSSNPQGGFGQDQNSQGQQQGQQGTSGFGQGGFGQMTGGQQGSGFGNSGGGFGSVGQTLGQPLSSGSSGDSEFGGNIIGVGSKTNEASIKVYKYATNYKQWEFIFDPLAQQQGGMGGGQVQGGITGAMGAGSISNQPGGNQNGFGNSGGFGNNGGNNGPGNGGGFGNGPSQPQPSGPELQNPQQ